MDLILKCMFYTISHVGGMMGVSKFVAQITITKLLRVQPEQLVTELGLTNWRPIY